MSKPHFTGRARKLQNRASVKIIDRISHVLITVGGIGTILSVSLVCIFLVWVAVPLFLPPAISEPHPAPLPESESASPIHLAMDEFRSMAWTLLDDGTLTGVQLASGRNLFTRTLFKSRKLTAWSFQIRTDEVAFGFEDGSFQVGKIGFHTHFLEPDETPPHLKTLKSGEVRVLGDGLVTRTPEGQFRHQTVSVTLEDPIRTDPPSPIIRIDQSITASGPVLCALSADGKLRIHSFEERMNLLTDRLERDLTTGEYDFEKTEGGLPRFLLISGLGDNVFAAWSDGRLIRLDVRDPTNPILQESLDLIAEEDVGLTTLEFLLGRTTLLAGDSTGRVRSWFRIKPARAKTRDGSKLVPVCTFPGGTAAVTAIASSPRSRMCTAGFSDGGMSLLHVTTGVLLGQTRTPGGKPVSLLTVSPRENGIFARVPDGIIGWDIDIKHPEASLTALFTPIWYEDYPKPEHVWQSSSGTDDSEPKLGLIPLVFGTWKATLYSLLFGIPIALLAAIYTSEFMKPRMRSVVKPTVELMASLPSVVLGFLAGLVFAPFVESVLPCMLTSFLTVPLAILSGAYLWQLLPHSLALRLASFRFPVLCLVLPLGLLVGVFLGPEVEALLFSGDFKGWLDHQHGTGTSGWFLLLIPICALGTSIIMGLYVNPWFRQATANRTRKQAAMLDITRFLLGTLCTLVVAFLISLMLTETGLDPRGSILDTYMQRNALVVGFVMGFAIIPIIYTIAEDALISIPEHLRSASLGTGATPWQTAILIVIPTAMSGLFSAVMIGLGRAVGETMIVLMAAGNTPVLDWNIFNGFRTLSANIAVELPEAVRNSTHYRTLFLSALTLFAMTFVLNTAAEAVRLRFRRRSHDL